MHCTAEAHCYSDNSTQMCSTLCKGTDNEV